MLKGRVTAGPGTDHRHGNRRCINKSYPSRGASSSLFLHRHDEEEDSSFLPGTTPPPPPFSPLFKRPGERWQHRRAPTITMTSSLQDWRQMKACTAAAVCTHVSLSASRRASACSPNVTTRRRWTSGSLPATLGGRRLA